MCVRVSHSLCVLCKNSVFLFLVFLKSLSLKGLCVGPAGAEAAADACGMREAGEVVASPSQMKTTSLERLHHLLKATQEVEELAFPPLQDLIKIKKNSAI